MALTAKERNALSPADFAVPETRELPIHDRIHTGMAWRVVDNTKGLTADQRATAKRRILHKAHDLGMDTSKWHLQAMSFSAMAIAFPDDAEEGHSNKLPFSGVLTRLDQPSDKPVGGTNGKRVILPTEAAQEALASLLGMGVDFTPSFDGHRPKVKIGLITTANIIGNAIEILGFFYAADFPEEVQFIQSEKEKLGFSFEAQSLMQDMSADPLVISACEFTGAAVLFKDKAAYFNTSIAAQAAQEPKMNDEEKKQFAAMLAGLASLTETVTKIAAAASPEAITASIKAALAATSVTAAAEAAEKAKADADKAAADKAAADAKAAAEANATALAAANDSIASLQTKIKDLEVKLAASSTGTGAPARKTLAPGAMATLKRIGLEASSEKGLTVAELDVATKKAGLDGQSSIALKLALKDAGMIAQ